MDVSVIGATPPVVELAIAAAADTATPPAPPAPAPVVVVPLFKDGDRVHDGEGTVYEMSHVTTYSHTLRRISPKVRGKAARKAFKRARQRQRLAAARA